MSASVSVIINNYNFGRFVGDAIESALAQTAEGVEVTVVDDGSTDGSREVIRRYADRIVAVWKENGGQASALNAGFARALGDVIVFLDSDDILVPRAVERIFPWFSDTATVKVHWPLREVDEAGEDLGKLMPGRDIPDGDLRERICRDGPATIAWPATSGNAWSRAFLAEVFPIPEGTFRIGADTWLFELAPLYGSLKTIAEPLSLYRRHGGSHSRGLAFGQRLQMELEFAESYFPAVACRCRECGYATDLNQWKRNSWWHKLAKAAEDLRQDLPDGAKFGLLDDASWAMDALDGRSVVPFPERNGMYAGPAAADADAIGELRRLRLQGVRYLVIGWPSFWWLGHYWKFARHLEAHSRLRLENERVIVRELLDV